MAEYITPTLRLLSDSARLHFEQVMEYLEAHELRYELAPELVELTQHGIHTVFEICSEDLPIYARGGRYDTLPYYMYRRRVPIASITITIPEKTTGTHIPTKKIKEPRVFLFHAGDRARLRSLYVLSKLCEANVPVAHRLHCLRVCDQLNERVKQYPYTIIYGQEEAENNVVCIRKTDTRASNTFRLDDQGLKTIRDLIRQ